MPLHILKAAIQLMMNGKESQGKASGGAEMDNSSRCDVVMHLFKCVICDLPMAGTGRADDGRCTFCLSVFAGISMEEARKQL